MAQDVWYYAVDDRRQGPVGRVEIDRMWRLGAIGPGTLVWRDGMDDWLPAGEVLGPPSAPDRTGRLCSAVNCRAHNC